MDRPVHAQTPKEGFAILSQRQFEQVRPSARVARLPRDEWSSPRLLLFADEVSHYTEQLSGLAQYASVKEIPQNPYDVSVRLAKRLTSYSDRIKLTPHQQSTYDQAVKLADEHGPCCSHCWRWTALRVRRNT